MKYNDSKNRMVTRNPYFSSTIKADEIVMYEVLQEALIYLTHLCLIFILFENNSAVDWRKVLLVLFMIFELGPYLESLWNGLPSELIRCGIKESFHPKN